MQPNLYSLILAALGNYSWHESSHLSVPQDKNLYLLLHIFISLYTPLSLPPVFVSVSCIFFSKKGGDWKKKKKPRMTDMINRLT